ncbi:hypothetical protein GCM10010187_52740 [Actinomadura coerulea]|nr:hypothetical protein GCM10010187_52740 [Actinomadura coerulea]
MIRETDVSACKAGGEAAPPGCRNPCERTEWPPLDTGTLATKSRDYQGGALGCGLTNFYRLRTVDRPGHVGLRPRDLAKYLPTFESSSISV